MSIRNFRNSIRLVLVLSLVLNMVLLFNFYSSNNKAHKPIWHPFQFSTQLSLESIVDDGYRFASMPCGQIQYTKTVADTTIQYEVDIDCDNSWYNRFLYPTLDYTTAQYTTKNKNGKIYAQNQENNIYFPWDIKQVRNCKHILEWSLYSVILGEKIDSLAVEDFLLQNHSNIKTRNNWNTENGGSFTARNYDTNLLYDCYIQYDNIDYPDSTHSWVLSIQRTVPDLD